MEGDAQMNFEQQYLAMGTRDESHAGEFFAAVTSTGIYCRPGCPARTPKRENVRFYRTATAARSDGFRACLRCHPDEYA
jgi:methylphosphotriester-DNA--protein-cysteine methyltransferase